MLLTGGEQHDSSCASTSGHHVHGDDVQMVMSSVHANCDLQLQHVCQAYTGCIYLNVSLLVFQSTMPLWWQADESCIGLCIGIL